jgi:predicted nucleic acid-binding protein
VGSLIATSVLAGARDIGAIADERAVSVVTVGELEAGILIAREETVRARRVALLAAVLAEAPALPIDRHVAARHGELRARTGRRPGNDLWIAATALAHDFTLLTADEQLASLPLLRSTLIEQ